VSAFLLTLGGVRGGGCWRFSSVISYSASCRAKDPVRKSGEWANAAALRSFPADARTRDGCHSRFSKVGDLCAPAAPRYVPGWALNPFGKTPSIRPLRGSCGESRFREAKMRRIPGYPRYKRPPTGTLAALGRRASWPALARCRRPDVTYERLLNPEPRNWLMQPSRFSARSAIRRSRRSTDQTSRLSGCCSPCRWAANRPARASRQRRWSMTASCTWSTAGGVVSKIDVRLGQRPAPSCGRWIPRRRTRTANRGGRPVGKTW